MTGAFRVVAVAVAACLLAAGCGGAGEPAGTTGSSTHAERDPATVSAAGRRSAPPALAPARCQANAANCRSADGRIVYVEAVDPDGDGDAHFVLLSAESVTAPGISVIDVERGLRPHPLPAIGDTVSAAGPVYRGSYGQRQIQATVLHVAPHPRTPLDR